MNAQELKRALQGCERVREIEKQRIWQRAVGITERFGSRFAKGEGRLATVSYTLIAFVGEHKSELEMYWNYSMFGGQSVCIFYAGRVVFNATWASPASTPTHNCRFFILREKGVARPKLILVDTFFPGEWMAFLRYEIIRKAITIQRG